MTTVLSPLKSLAKTQRTILWSFYMYCEGKKTMGVLRTALVRRSSVKMLSSQTLLLLFMLNNFIFWVKLLGGKKQVHPLKY